MHAGPPVSVTVAAPEPSISTALVTLAVTVAGPSAPIVASLVTRPPASSRDIPRTTAVIFAARPASAALPAPATATRSWSTSALPIRAAPEPWTDRSKPSPRTLSISMVPEPLSQAAVNSCVPTLISTGP